jgi:hypothetical protein
MKNRAVLFARRSVMEHLMSAVWQTIESLLTRNQGIQPRSLTKDTGNVSSASPSNSIWT